MAQIFLIQGGAAAPPYLIKRFRRFRRPLPLAFLILAALVFLGAAIYPPTNYSGLQYRTARVLQWLAHEQWFWIHTVDTRMNNRACGMEWLTAPLLLFTRSDRAALFTAMLSGRGAILRKAFI